MKLQTAKGIQDIIPEEKIIQNKIVQDLKETFEQYGFSPLETPIIERLETLSAKFTAGEASDALKETFKLKDQGKRNLGLRFDLTVPLARFVGMNPQLPMPFKRYEMGSVFRDGPIRTGRVRQFLQCDIDTIGTSSMLAEAEILSAADSAFKKIGLDVKIKLNNRRILNGILDECGIKKKEEAIIAIDKLDKIGQEGVIAEFKERKIKSSEKLFKLVKPGISLSELKKKVTSEETLKGISELEEVFGYLDKMNVYSIVFDVSLARGLAYYTGPVYEVFVKDGSLKSSLAAGGRWDNMIGSFLGKNSIVPAVGVSFGIVPIIECLKKKEEFSQKSLTKVYVIPIKTLDESLGIVQELRSQNINAAVDLLDRNISKNLKYANSLGIPYVIIVGKRELDEEKVLLRDMKSGDQFEISVKEVVKKIK
ncbi:histidine--tRNA ligase [archaeon]|jgi:histidyl-tRNA synthetase|nr:histidine--tRNA ligase [archaeon]MBT3451694.1 histidine--tRNA ligase [archaeon]MBT6869374.1 histidine--tRNA ligase [archaeon]MBT7192537.1 histidine--tRNA ligase [archaeon]MBT7380613.1 histidine--tRNA ligase [archaeon]